MSESHRILSAYQSLVHGHSPRFDPQLHQLQQVVTQLGSGLPIADMINYN